MMFVFQSAIASLPFPGRLVATRGIASLFLEAPPERLGVVGHDLRPSVEDGAEADTVRRPGLPHPELPFADRFHPLLALAGREEELAAADVHAERREPRVVRPVQTGELLPGDRHLRIARFLDPLTDVAIGTVELRDDMA